MKIVTSELYRNELFRKSNFSGNNVVIPYTSEGALAKLKRLEVVETKQKKRQGYNKLNYTNTEFTPSAQSWCYLNGKSGAYGSTIASDTNLKVAIEKGKEYTFYYKEKSNIKTLQLVYDNEEIAVNNIEQNYAMFTANKDGFIVPRMLNLETNKVTYIKDVMIYESIEEKPYEPYGVMPSLQYPSEIEAVKDCVEISTSNKNIYDKNTMKLKQGLWISRTKIAGNGAGWYVIVPVLGGKTISISRKASNIFCTTTADYPANGVEVLDAWKEVKNTNRYTMTTNQNARYLFLGLAAASSLTNEQIAHAVDELQVEYADTSSDYIEHRGQTHIMPIQQKMLKGDYFDIENKKEVHLWKRRVFDGTESFGMDTTNKSFYVQENRVKRLTDYKDKIFCNCYDSIENFEKKNASGVSCYHRSNYPNQNWIYFTDENYATVDEFKAMLAQKHAEGNPVYVDFMLTEPIVLDCTEEQIAVLNKLENMSTYADKTIIMIDNDMTEMTVEAEQSRMSMLENLTRKENEVLCENS